MGLRDSQWTLSLPLLPVLRLFLYSHRRMAITGDDVSLDQIVPVSRDFTLEEGATGVEGYESLSLGPLPQGVPAFVYEGWAVGVGVIWGLGCSVAKEILIFLPDSVPRW